MLSYALVFLSRFTFLSLVLPVRVKECEVRGHEKRSVGHRQKTLLALARLLIATIVATATPLIGGVSATIILGVAHVAQKPLSRAAQKDHLVVVVELIADDMHENGNEEERMEKQMAHVNNFAKEFVGHQNVGQRQSTTPVAKPVPCQSTLPKRLPYLSLYISSQPTHPTNSITLLHLTTHILHLTQTSPQHLKHSPQQLRAFLVLVQPLLVESPADPRHDEPT